MFQFRRWVTARLIQILTLLTLILKEVTLTRASTQHLNDAVSALATSVAAGLVQINTELASLLENKAADDDAAVETNVANIKAISTSIDVAVKAAQTALTTVPADAASAAPDPAPSPAPAPAADPNAAPQS